MFFEFAQVYLRMRWAVRLEGSFPKRMIGKNFSETAEEKQICSCIIYKLFLLQIFCETSHSRQGPKVYVA